MKGDIPCLKKNRLHTQFSGAKEANMVCGVHVARTRIVARHNLEGASAASGLLVVSMSMKINLLPRKKQSALTVPVWVRRAKLTILRPPAKILQLRASNADDPFARLCVLMQNHWTIF